MLVRLHCRGAAFENDGQSFILALETGRMVYAGLNVRDNACVGVCWKYAMRILDKRYGIQALLRLVDKTAAGHKRPKK